MDTIEEYLKEMNLTYRVIPQEDRIVLPYNIQDRRFLLIIDRGDKWIRFFINIVDATALKNVDKLALFSALLEANGQLAEVKFFLTNEGSVGVIGHEGVGSLTFKGFQEEYNALPFGVSFFLENIAPKLKIQVKGID